MIDEEFYTVMTNRQVGKIALLAETLQLQDLNRLTDKISAVKNVAKESRQALTPRMKNFVSKAFPQLL